MRRVLAHAAVPLLFAALCLFGIIVAHITLPFLLGEMLVRVGRNTLLVLSLLIPILAGLGLNFGIVIGAMAGQIAAMLVVHWGVGGIAGFGLAWLLATPIGVLFGIATGALFNRAKGREMVAGLIAGFFANGLYQLVFLFAVGSLIPFHNVAMVLPQGYGLRNTVDLTTIQYAVDDLLPLKLSLEGVETRLPLATYAVVALLCAFTLFFFRTRLGQQLRAMGQDAHVAEIAGIAVDRNRVVATVLSTVFAAWGQLLFLQNIGTLNTYNSHEQVGMFAIAALLVSGATVTRATIGQALLGTVLFHTLFVVSPLAGKALAGDAQIGEYFRVFVAYAVITVALALHAWQAVRAARFRRGLLLAAFSLGFLCAASRAAAAPIFKLVDPRGDDHGDGSLVYPDRGDFRPGDLDLISLSARPEGDGTLFEATFARPIRRPARRPVDEGGASLDRIARFGFYTLNLDVYIDTDRVEGSGETAMLPGRRAEIERAFAWERAVCLTPSPYEAEEALKRIWFDAAKERLKESSPHLTDATEDSLRQTVAADVKRRVFFPTRIRVAASTIRFLVPGSFLDGTARAAWGYVIAVSGADVVQRLDLGAALGLKKRPAPSLMILPVKTGRSREAFGGGREEDALEPPLVDIVVPSDKTQEAALRDYDPARGRPVRLPGVVPMRAAR